MDADLILILIIVGVFMLHSNGTLQYITETMSLPGITGMFGSRLHSYNSGCLTTKPYGFSGCDGPNKYWEDRRKNWAVEYSQERVRGDINKVRSSKATSNIATGPTEAQSISSEYYHNPVKYCKTHPDSYPCPNHWISEDHKKFKGRIDFKSADMYVPGLAKGNFYHIKDADINDNYHTRVINPAREDHGTCQT